MQIAFPVYVGRQDGQIKLVRKDMFGRISWTESPRSYDSGRDDSTDYLYTDLSQARQPASIRRLGNRVCSTCPSGNTYSEDEE